MKIEYAYKKPTKLASELSVGEVFSYDDGKELCMVLKFDLDACGAFIEVINLLNNHIVAVDGDCEVVVRKVKLVVED